MRDEIPEELYTPAAQRSFADGGTIYARITGDRTATTQLLRKEATSIDPNVPVYDMRTLADMMETSLVTERLLATLSSVFGLLATILAALGLYGVMAFLVARRTREIGIRMALGAAQRDVLWMVLRETLTLAFVGVAIGLGCAWPLTKLVQTQLFGIAPSDLATMAAASFGIAAVTALAGFIPARRATTIDPMLALRWE
jgi:ABC-type antimicrobial peptide transport system permease subunit